ncbi:MAG TPA: amidohydrolase family protein [Allosphingosinicella sp.]|nr:amidohydrolase family protein [Allosphingosinicella sp.]
MTMRVASCLAVAIAALALAGCAGAADRKPAASAAETEPALAFTSVNVLPMTAGEPVLRDYSVLVENGRIAAVGPSASLPIPSHAVRIDGRGKYLMPGLADMHAHLEHFDGPEYLKLFLVHGVTMVRSMDGRPNILDWKRQAAAGTLASPDIHTAGQVLDGSPPVRDDNLALATPAEGRRAVEQQAAAGYDFVKVYANLSAPTFQAIVQAAAARNLPVAGHVPRAVPLDAFLASGVASLEHLGDFADAIAAPPASGAAAPAVLKRRLGFPADQGRMEALAAKVAASRIRVVPTIVADDRLVAAAADVERWMKDPEAAAVDRGILNHYWRGTVSRGAERVGAANWRWVEQGKANRRNLLRALHRAGVPLLLGTDTPQPFVFPGASVHDELANYVEAGLTPAQALALATREPARFLRQHRNWGTVEPAKRANLLLLDANPLADIAATRRIAGVVTGGRWLPVAELERMRREVEAVAAASE